MKHAGPDALDALERLLGQLRRRSGLSEKSRGIFYRGSRAFLHFHEDGAQLFADVRLAGDFVRLPASTSAQQAILLRKIDAVLGRGKR